MTKPYELLARFNRDGTVSGVSVRTIETVGGREYESDPVPLAGATDPAFKSFAEMFSAAALAERDAALTERDAAVAERDTLRTERDTLRTERDALRTELDAIRNPTDASGFPVLSAVQLRLGILAAGLTLEGIDAAIAAMPDPVARVRVETYWQYATQFERSHPLVAGMVSMLGLTDTAADDLWRAAGALS